MHCIFEEWGRPQLSLAGLACAALAIGAAALFWRQARARPRHTTFLKERRLLFGFALFLLVVAGSELVGGERLGGAIVRCALIHEGAYDGRRPLQLGLMFAAAVGVLAAAALVRAHYRSEIALTRIPLGAGAGLGLFLGFRMVSLHQFDAILRDRLFVISLNHGFELGFLALILAAAVRMKLNDHDDHHA